MARSSSVSQRSLGPKSPIPPSPLASTSTLGEADQRQGQVIPGGKQPPDQALRVYHKLMAEMPEKLQQAPVIEVKPAPLPFGSLLPLRSSS